ncbi:alpha-1,3-arabinosyltransferase XAT2-like [Zingiber officinale]|uniref:alpha-1,3-arabinosyltransferase XAT2-like n=1 Tax=Zingiber officinale TaxID=94328 RepID=UPI001C4D8AB9|nr:alpha-1,3-arabinosyltransferase XAT2-like [Zingiber officinale]
MVTKLRLIRNGNQCRKYKHAAVAAGFFFVAMAFLVVYKPQSLAVPNFGFRASIANPDSGSNMVNGEDDHARNSLASGRNDDKEEAFSENYYISDSKKESGREFKDTMLNQETMHVELPIASNSTAPMQLAAGEAIRRRKPLCDVSDPRVDICEMSGDIRIAGNSSSILFIEPEAAARPPEQWRVRPYPRKGDDTCLGGVRQFAVVSARSDGAPQCTVDHGDVPAVVFSVGGYTGNLFHDFTDLLVPLFVTAGPFHGKIQFVVADWKSWWINKYLVVFRKLTNYQLMDLEQQSAGQVHCFKQVVVGLRAHKEFLIDPARSPNRYTMVDFKRFMRIAFSLERDALNNATDGGHLPPRRKPRLMLIARKQSRAFTNVPEIVAMAEELGFEVMVAEADAGSDLARFAGVVNSCDVMVGVHGAGLTNMVFLPANATVVQVVPWGALEWLAMLDFGNPAKAMGLHYVQYSIGIEESTLRERYPRGHAVFTDPMSFHRRGFAVVRSTFMVRQDVKLDVKRFRELLGKEVGHMVQ